MSRQAGKSPASLTGVFRKKSTRRRLVRYGIITFNVLLLVGVGLFVFKASRTAHAAPASVVASASSETVANPLDQISSADIAVTAARLTGLAETTAVVNQADSARIELAMAGASPTLAAKPQVLNAHFTSYKDIKTYIVQNGDTVSSVAQKFNITSDSVRWSNGIDGDELATGQKLYIPPVNGIVYIVKSGDTPNSLAEKFKARADQIIAVNDAEIQGLRVGQRILIPNGQVTPPPTVSYTPAASYAWGMQAVYGSNGYDFGWCTWYVANRRAELGNPVPNNLGNASTWYIIAASAGLPTGSTPRPGAVMVNQGGDHVAVVEKVNSDGSFWISEMNAYGQVSITNSTPKGGWDVIDYRLVSAGEASAEGLRYIY